MKRIVIVGGGASGLAAAVQAATAAAETNLRADILVVEKMPRVGKKLLATGNGRCNLTNREIAAGHYRTGNPETLGAVLNGLDTPEILRFFRQMGLWCAEREAGRIYPSSNLASSVLDVFMEELAQLGVRIQCGFAVRNIRRSSGGYLVQSADGERIAADALILSAGGSAAPSFGTDGGGFALAKALGHTVTAPYPALTPLKTAGDTAKGLKGVRAVCTATLFKNGKAAAKETGEVQFAEYGLSGIPIMQLSNRIEADTAGWTVGLDLFEDESADRLRQELSRRIARNPDGTLETLLSGMLHKRIGYAAMKRAGLAPLSRLCRSLSAGETDCLAETLKQLSFEVTGRPGWQQAQATGGGVPLSEIDPVTMESGLARGVYLCGELLDAVGECGGYNLHWAWATGIRAGRAVCGFGK